MNCPQKRHHPKIPQTDLTVALTRIAEAAERQAVATEDHSQLLSELINAIQARGKSQPQSNDSSTMSAAKAAIAHLVLCSV